MTFWYTPRIKHSLSPSDKSCIKKRANRIIYISCPEGCGGHDILEGVIVRPLYCWEQHGFSDFYQFGEGWHLKRPRAASCPLMTLQYPSQPTLELST